MTQNKTVRERELRDVAALDADLIDGQAPRAKSNNTSACTPSPKSANA